MVFNEKRAKEKDEIAAIPEEIPSILSIKLYALTIPYIKNKVRKKLRRKLGKKLVTIPDKINKIQIIKGRINFTKERKFNLSSIIPTIRIKKEKKIIISKSSFESPKIKNEIINDKNTPTPPNNGI